MTKMMTIFLSLMALSFTNILPAQDCPQLLGSAPTAGNTWGVAVSGNYAYAVDADKDLFIFNVSNPAVPVQTAELTLPDQAFGVAVSGNYAYVADNDTGLLVVDVSNPAAPAIVGSIVLGGGVYTYHVFVSGHYAYATGANTLYIVNVANPAAPTLAGSLDTLSYTHFCAMKDHYLYVADHDAGVLIVDVSDPTAPAAAGTISGFQIAQGIAVSGNLLYVVDYWASTLSVFDISSPPSPAQIGMVSTYSAPSQVAISGNLALLAVQNVIGEGAFQVFDFTDPTAPFQAGIASTDYSEDIAVSGTHAYLADTTTMPIFDFGACTVPSGPQYFIPAAAKTTGGFGTNWVTDVVIHNPEDVAVTAALYYLPTGTDNTGALPHIVSVNAQTSLKIQDIVGSLFAADGTSGAIRIIASAPLLIGSRTYNDQGTAGTYGQSIDGLLSDNAFGNLNQPRLIQLAKNAAYRTNMGFVNTTTTPLTVNVYIYAGADGSFIGNWSVTLSAYEHHQESNIIQELTGADVDDAYAVITTLTSGGRYFAYASVVDNRTGDPTYIAAR